MGTLDDFLRDMAGIAEGRIAEGGADETGEVLEVQAEPILDEADMTPTQRARRRLQEGSRNHTEGPEGTFRACGSRHGCGYAEAVLTVDDASAQATLLIRSGMYLSPCNVRAARKICRKLNQGFILEGLGVSDGGELVFAPEPLDLGPDGADLDGAIGKGFSTIRHHVYLVEELEAGRDPLEVLRGPKRADGDEEDNGPEGLLERLRALSSLIED